MTIEFFGLPGSGKTFIANNYANELKCFNFNEWLFSKKGNIYFKLFIHLHLAKIVQRKKYYEMCCVFKEYMRNKNIFGFKTKLKEYISQIIFIYDFEKRFSNNNLVMDEGIAHHLIAIEAEYEVPHEIILKAFSLFNSKNKIVYVDVSLKTACYRIKQRNRKFSPMDFLTDDKLQNFLTKYKECCEKIVYSSSLQVEVINND